MLLRTSKHVYSLPCYLFSTGACHSITVGYWITPREIKPFFLGTQQIEQKKHEMWESVSLLDTLAFCPKALSLGEAVWYFSRAVSDQLSTGIGLPLSPAAETSSGTHQGLVRPLQSPCLFQTHHHQ